MHGEHDALRLWRALMSDRPPSATDIVPGARTVTVTGVRALELPASRYQDEAGAAAGARHELAVAYDGPDLAAVASFAGLSGPAEVASLHSGAEWLVDFLGFVPGFAYLSGGDSRLAVPRLAVPRPSVPAGSVALAGGMSAVYPATTPGGWQLIGTTDAQLWDPFRPEPSLLSPGDRVSFRPVGRSELRPSRATRRSPAEVISPGLTVLEAGPLATIQDLGRPGWAHLGVSPGGAADRAAAIAANRIVGNTDGAAVIEFTLGPFRLRAAKPVTVAVTGAVGELQVDGLPARRRAALALRAGSELRAGRANAGLRFYVAVGGGVDAPRVLGSRSRDTLAGFGPDVLRDGTRLGVGDLRAGLELPPPPDGDLRAPVTVTVHTGPRWDWVDCSALTESIYRVMPESDRTGLRLAGPPLTWRRSGELPSEGLVAGAVQVPPGAQPVVMMRNHPTTGGFPVVAVVDDDGVDRLAQCRPGDEVRFLSG